MENLFNDGNTDGPTPADLLRSEPAQTRTVDLSNDACDERHASPVPITTTTSRQDTKKD